MFTIDPIVIKRILAMSCLNVCVNMLYYEIPFKKIPERERERGGGLSKNFQLMVILLYEW